MLKRISQKILLVKIISRGKDTEMRVGEVLAGYRRDRKVSVEQLAREIGLKPVALWRLEQGKFAYFKQWPAVVLWLFGK
jgi:ribosome-binding protein aMBF1 (putative translation factor)